MTYGKPVAGVCLATALFVCGAGGYPAAPSTLPPSSGSLSTAGASTTVAPGATLTVSGGGFASHAAVTMAVYTSPQLLDHVVADARGHVTDTVTLPKNLRGEHTITALGDGPNRTPHVLTYHVKVAAASASAPTALASTGFKAMEWILGGLALIVAGFALIRTAMFRRRLLPDRG